MQLEKLKGNSIFIFSADIEAIWGAVSILKGEFGHQLWAELYRSNYINRWKWKYAFLFETFQVIEKTAYMNIMDFLLDIPLENITLQYYREMLLELPEEEFVWRMLDLERIENADKNMLRKALTEEKMLVEAYSWVMESCGSFLAFSAFVRQSKRFITDFFSLAQELEMRVFEEAISAREKEIEEMLKEIRSEIEHMEPLVFSEKKLGKSFRNRGPYDEYVFIPTLLMPMKACRYFHTEGEKKRQILFLTLQKKERNSEDTVQGLKAIADKNRYQILSLLAKEGPMRGLDIAKKISLAASTVSHHMEQLSGSGLITEENVKSAKYYGINQQGIKLLVQELKKDFDIEG